MYKAEHYNVIFEEMRRRFGETWYQSVQPTSWNIWRKQIKEWLFEHDILIAEIVLALDEAAGKRRWPIGTSFFRRVEDVVYKNRIEAKRSSPVKVDGMSALGDLLPRQ